MTKATKKAELVTSSNSGQSGYEDHGVFFLSSEKEKKKIKKKVKIDQMPVRPESSADRSSDPTQI